MKKEISLNEAYKYNIQKVLNKLRIQGNKKQRPQSANAWHKKPHNGKQKSRMINEVFQDLSNSRQSQYFTKSITRKDSPGFSKSTKHKITPEECKRIHYDMINLKRKLNLYKEENIKLKAQANNIKRELKSKRSYAKEINKNTKRMLWIKERSLMMMEPELTKRAKSMRREIEKTKQERDALAKYTNISKLQEVKDELIDSLEECKRLRGMIEEATNEEFNAERIDEPERLMMENQQLLKSLEIKRKELQRLKEVSKKKYYKKGYYRSQTSEYKKSKKSTPLKSKETVQIENELRRIKQELDARILCFIHR